MFVIHKSSVGYVNKFYDYENNNKKQAKTKNSVKSCEKKVTKRFVS